MSYQEEFDAECREEFKNYRNELEFIMNNDVDDIAEKYGLQGDDGEPADIRDYVTTYTLAMDKPVSGYSLNASEDTDVFYDDVSYVVITKATGGPRVDFIIGSNGEAFVDYSYGDTKGIQRVGGDFEDSPLHQYVGELYGAEFTKNEFNMAPGEEDGRLKDSLGVDTAAEWFLQNSDGDVGEMVSFRSFVGALEISNFNAVDAATYLLDHGEYNYVNSDFEELGIDDFVPDIERHIETIEKLKLRSDWDDVVTVFDIKESNLTEFDADDIEDALVKSFSVEEDEPEQKAKSTNKFKI